MRSPPDKAPITYFVDRSLGKLMVPNALRAAGAKVEVHDDHFPQNCPDETWLKEVGHRGWAVLTKDRHIRRRKAERRALLEHDVAAFFVQGGDLSGELLAMAVIRALPEMNELAETQERPFIAIISKTGKLDLLQKDPGR